MSIERLKPAHFFDEERLAALKQLAPEAFSDGKINWSTLKDALGSELEESEEDTEHFGLSWPGKRESRRLAGKPSTGTLVPAKGEGIDEDTSRNIYIEGENLEVLKLLRKSYTGQVKMIYIDPPYNTGNDFVYDDDFAEPLQEYLKRTGQIDGEGKPTTTNKKADGRFHSKWLSMMYPRLRLARELLRDDGVIFVSIDDNEVHHLRMLLNEVFGEENFVGQLVWRKKNTPDARQDVDPTHEYVCCFTKDSITLADDDMFGILPFSDERRKSYSNPDNDPRGSWASVDMTGMTGRATKDQYFNVKLPSGRQVAPPAGRAWGIAPKTFEQLLADNRIWFGESGNNVPRIKRFLSEAKGQNTGTLLKENESGSTENAKKQLLEILASEEIFDFPKPIELIKRFITMQNRTDDIILDFFSGSATTAHAVLDLNKEDGGKRRFILVQMPEATPTDSEAAKAGYKNIAEIGKERIRRVIKKIKDQKAGELEGTKDLDLGFKVFKLAKSHYKQWENYHGESVEKIEELFAEFITPLVPNWRQIEQGLLTEILLLEGFPLDSTIVPLSAYTDNTMVEVSSTFHQHHLLICLDDQLAPATVDALQLRENDSFICLDAAIDTETKTRLADKGQIKTI